MKIIQINQFPDNMPLNQWQDSFIWCPSQCYMHAQRDGVDYVLYLRWRWSDPWQAHIIKNAWDETSMHNDNAEWSPDLFEQNSLFFADKEHEAAKAKLTDLFAQYR